MKKRMALIMVLIFGLGVVLASCAGMQNPGNSGWKDPVVTLASFTVPQYDGYWYISAKTKPTKGKAGNRGAPLPMSFLFNIHNPNPYPVLLDDFKFTVAFEKDFDVVTVNVQDEYWIHARKTDQIRATTMITVRSALLSLLVTGGYKLKARGVSPWAALEKWWTGVPDYAVPVMVHEGAASFSADGVAKVVAF
ncbi:MAG: hypothetical protein JRJ51_25815, partial [Deltaproteobacteria bacterium]|nr:hypothetical protein [Deltaproteobacteria bacterium]